MIQRRRLALWGTAGLAAAAGAGWSWWRQEPLQPPDDAFWAMRFEQPQGGELSLASIRGRILVLNFWATWCPPCIEELPELDRLHTTHASRGVQVLGLAVDSPTPVRQFLARQPLSFPVGLAGFEGTELTRRLGNESGALPFTAVFDRAGRQRHRKLGRTNFDELSGWIRAL